MEEKLEKFETAYLFLKEPIGNGKDLSLVLKFVEYEVGLATEYVVITDKLTKETTFIPFNNVRSLVLSPKKMLIN